MRVSSLSSNSMFLPIISFRTSSLFFFFKLSRACSVSIITHPQDLFFLFPQDLFLCEFLSIWLWTYIYSIIQAVFISMSHFSIGLHTSWGHGLDFILLSFSDSDTTSCISWSWYSLHISKGSQSLLDLPLLHQFLWSS